VFHCVCVCCVSLLHLSCVSDFIQFIFIRAVFSAVFSLTVLPGLLFVLIDFFLVFVVHGKQKIYSFIHSRKPVISSVSVTVTCTTKNNPKHHSHV